MSLKKTSKKEHGSMAELNITPLLDLVFVLLVIFIITTPQLVNNLEMTLPSPKPPPPEQKEKPKPNKIVISAAGKIFLDDAPCTLAELKTELQRRKTANPDLSVVVKGSDAVDYQYMVNVLDILRQLDISKVGLATDAVQ